MVESGAIQCTEVVLKLTNRILVAISRIQPKMISPSYLALEIKGVASLFVFVIWPFVKFLKFWGFRSEQKRWKELLMTDRQLMIDLRSIHLIFMKSIDISLPDNWLNYALIDPLISHCESNCLSATVWLCTKMLLP